MNIKHLFWKIYYCRPAWAKHSRFAVHYVPDQIDGVMYAGITLFGHSLIYSDLWL